MNQNKKILTGIIVTAFLIAAYFVIAKSVNVARVSVAPEDAAAKEVLCDVSVSNPRGIPLVKNGDLVIENADCQQQYVSNCARFGLFSDAGSLRLEAEGGLGSATDINVGEGSSQSYSLNWCGSKFTKTFKIRLFNENNENIQVKEVTLQ